MVAGAVGGGTYKSGVPVVGSPVGEYLVDDVCGMSGADSNCDS